MIIVLNAILSQAVGASVRIFDLMDRIPQIRDGSQKLDYLKGRFAFEKVTFKYPSRPENEVLQVRKCYGIACQLTRCYVQSAILFWLTYTVSHFVLADTFNCITVIIVAQC